MKITRYFAMLAAVAGLSSACQEELEHVVYNPENVVAPVLNAVEDIEITVDELSEGNVKFSWEAADFGVAAQVYYSLDMSAEVEGETKTVNLFKNVSGKEGSASYEKINGHLLYDFNFTAGEPGEVSFTLYAGLKVGATYASNVVKANATAAVAERTYPTVWVIGDYCGWDHGKTQFLYDYDGADDVYSGLVDFGEKAANGFKLTGIAGWDDTCNWGEETKATEADEPAKVQLITGGGSQDIKRYAKRFYGFSFSKKTLELTNNYGFNKVGIIGLNGDWENDIEMEFNAAAQKQVFYADVEVAAATEFKFRMDGAWDLNFGGDMKALTVNGDNIAIEPGNYRIYLNLNNPAAVTCSLDTRMYGKEEGGAAEPPVEEPEPEKPAYKGWGIVGSAVGSWDVDVPMTSDGTWHVAKQVVLAEGEAKFRLDAAWDTNLGGATFEANKELTLTAGGDNIAVVPGTYDIYLNPTDAKVWFINDGSYPGGGAAPEASEWGVVGQVNGWAAPDITMYKTDTEGLFVAYNVAMPDGGFKIRANGEWNDAANYGLEGGKGNVEVDHAYDVITSGGSGDMVLVAGNYDIWFDLTNTKVYIMTPGKPISEAEGGEAVVPEPEPEPETQDWYLVGDFNGWTAADASYKLTLDGNWYVFKNFTADGKGVKFVADANWTVNRGGTFVAAGEAIEVVHDGANLEVAAGTYDVYLSKDASVAYFMTPGEAPAAELDGTWYLVGDFNGWSAADENYKMTAENGWYVFKNFTADGKGVKFVADANWTVNRGGTFVAAGEAIEVVHDGANLEVAAGSYDVYLNADASKAYFMEVGKTPAN